MNRRALFEQVNRAGHALRRRLDGWSRQTSGRDAALWPGRSVGAEAKPTRVVGRVRHAGHWERLRAGTQWLPRSMGASNMPVERARVTVSVAVEVGVRAAHWQRWTVQ
jgi:hypothetical protein